MKIQTELEVTPFHVPQLIDADFQGIKFEIPLSEIPLISLSGMCKDWIIRVYEEAGREAPQVTFATPREPY